MPTSPAPGEVVVRAVGAGIDRTFTAKAGYVGVDYVTAGLYGQTSSASNALHVRVAVGSRQNVAVVGAEATSTPNFGAVVGINRSGSISAPARATTY